mmetsp:Transcript_120458/g.225157  ORF Transcript_120458/g.225157 Transcript_120458/m.225157 type:complete len:314 (+) Transcript_120458:57-998(+)
MLRPDPAAAIDQICKEVKEKFGQAGIDKVKEGMKSASDAVDKLKSGPAELLASVEKQVSQMKGKIHEMTEDPSQISPKRRRLDISGCGTRYCNAVATKLDEVGKDSGRVARKMTESGKDLTASVKEASEKLRISLSVMDKSFKAMAVLPTVILKEVQGKSKPDDIAKINTGPMKKILAAGNMAGPLQEAGGMSNLFGEAAATAAGAVATFDSFIRTFPEKIEGSFSPGFPYCCMTAALPQQAQDILKMTDELKKIDLRSMVKSLEGASAKVSDAKKTADTFQQSVKGLVDKLDTTVNGAKMASGGASSMGRPF